MAAYPNAEGCGCELSAKAKGKQPEEPAAPTRLASEGKTWVKVEGKAAVRKAGKQGVNARRASRLAKGSYKPPQIPGPAAEGSLVVSISIPCVLLFHLPPVGSCLAGGR